MSEPRWPLLIHQAIPTNWRQSLGATLYPDGAFHVDVPGVLRRGPEIGYYVHQLGVARALEFRALVEQANLWTLPHRGVFAPEQHRVLFMEGEDDDMRSVSWAIDAIPDEVTPILDVFNRLVDEACASPREVLAGEARWGASSFSAREPLQIEFALRNKGRDPISVQNPQTPRPRESLLQLVVSPAGPPPGRTPTPRSMMIRPTQRPRDAAAEILELAPGQAVSFTETPSVYLSPGEYQAVLIFDTGWTSQGPRNHVRGVLAMEMPLLRVVHR